MKSEFISESAFDVPDERAQELRKLTKKGWIDAVIDMIVEDTDKEDALVTNYFKKNLAVAQNENERLYISFLFGQLISERGASIAADGIRQEHFLSFLRSMRKKPDQE